MDSSPLAVASGKDERERERHKRFGGMGRTVVGMSTCEEDDAREDGGVSIVFRLN